MHIILQNTFCIRLSWRRGNDILANCESVRLFYLLIRQNVCVQSWQSSALRLKEVSAAAYDESFEQLPERNVSLSYFLQSYKYFRDVEDQLRVDLTFKRSVSDTARRWLDNQTPEKWTAVEFARVVIHVRRKDYAQLKHEVDGWPTPTTDYFRRSMSYFTDCLDRVQFVVLSDDFAWCRKHINATDIVYSSGHSPIVDMAIASLCDHAIITIGSYGWWAAWFANGVTITQKNLPRNGSWLARRLHRDDYYKPEWIGL